MAGRGTKLLTAAALLALATGPVAHGQEVTQLPALRPAEPLAEASELPAPRPAPPGPDFTRPALAAPAAPAADFTLPAAAGPAAPRLWAPEAYRLPPVDESELPPEETTDPLLDPHYLAPPGWYATAEMGFIGPHIKNRMFNAVTVSPVRTDTVHVPQAALDWTVSPRVEVGYRVPQGFGEFLTNFRFLNTQGAENVSGDQGTARLDSHLSLQVLDFDYANRHVLTPLWNMELRWKVGVESTAAFFDSRATGLNPAAGGGTGPVEQRVSNNIVGAGPHAGVELYHHLPVPGLALYGQFEGAALWVHQTQAYEETLAAGAGGPLSAATRVRESQGVGVLGGQLGLSWTPPTARYTRFLAGYQFRWWEQLGRLSGTASDAELTEQGIFLRGEFSF